VRPFLFLAIAGIAALIAGAARPSSSASKTRTQSDTTSVTYCDLIHNPERYNGKTVRTNVTYRFGFEWAEFYCLDCWDMDHRTWVEYEHDLCAKSKKIKDNDFRGRTVNLQVVGKFYGAGRYGHMGAYQFKFVVDCVESAKTIWDNSFVPSSLPPDIAKKASCAVRPQR
jgi:hypothetical protein